MEDYDKLRAQKERILAIQLSDREEQLLKQLNKVSTALFLIMEAIGIDPAATSVSLSEGDGDLEIINVDDLLAETYEFTKKIKYIN